MYTRIAAISLCLLLSGLMIAGCIPNQKGASTMQLNPPLVAVHQIDSFKTRVACEQALEVINNNPYEQELFEKVFARIVEQCKNNKSPDNADIIWEHFIVSLNTSGKVPPDLAKTTWNYYFARQFVSLPDSAIVTHYCSRLAGIKKNIEKEFRMKKAGFEVCKQGSPEAQFLNAMYVYNTMWAVCHDTE
jgi:hypothetical protein